MTLPGSRYCADRDRAHHEHRLDGEDRGPGFLDELPDRLVLPLLLELPAEDRHLAARRVTGDRVVMGGRHLAACHLDASPVQGAELLDPLLEGPPVELGEFPVVAENVADERLVVRDLELVHRRTRGDPTFLNPRDDRPQTGLLQPPPPHPVADPLRERLGVLLPESQPPDQVFDGHGVQRPDPERVRAIEGEGPGEFLQPTRRRLQLSPTPS